jgi:hypothetical protein
MVCCLYGTIFSCPFIQWGSSSKYGRMCLYTSLCHLPQVINVNQKVSITMPSHGSPDRVTFQGSWFLVYVRHIPLDCLSLSAVISFVEVCMVVGTRTLLSATCVSPLLNKE